MRYCGRRIRGKRKRAVRILIFIGLVTAVAGLLLLYGEKRLAPIVRTLALSQVRANGVDISNEAVLDITEEMGIDYDEIVMLEKDSSGRISALKTDTVKVNIIKSRIASRIQRCITSGKIPPVTVPIGSILSGELLSGKGPGLRVDILPAGSVNVGMENVFCDAGINQTRHQIMLHVQLYLTVILPTERVTAEVVTSVCIAETVIVGEVPDAFTQVITPEGDLSGILNDFGAELERAG